MILTLFMVHIFTKFYVSIMFALAFMFMVMDFTFMFHYVYRLFDNVKCIIIDFGEKKRLSNITKLYCYKLINFESFKHKKEMTSEKVQYQKKL